MTIPKDEIVLPPKPEREEIGEVKTLSDCARAINYYEHLVQKWELWADTVENVVKEK